MGEQGEKFVRGMGWEVENGSGGKCRASMRLHKTRGEVRGNWGGREDGGVGEKGQGVEPAMTAGRGRPRFSWETGDLVGGSYVV